MNEQAVKWANTLGMLPVNFLHDQHVDVEKYAMLNGFTNNFCLSLNHNVDALTARNSAWSANMANSVSVVNDTLYLFSLDKTEPEQIAYSYVMRNLFQFYDYLGSNKLNVQDGIIL